MDLLEHGELMGVAVGGAREALFDSDYSADWGGRAGFAKVRCSPSSMYIIITKCGEGTLYTLMLNLSALCCRWRC